MIEPKRFLAPFGFFYGSLSLLIIQLYERLYVLLFFAFYLRLDLIDTLDDILYLGLHANNRLVGEGPRTLRIYSGENGAL